MKPTTLSRVQDLARLGYRGGRVGLLLGSLVGATFLLTAMPYLVYRPSLPFGADVHHEVNVSYMVKYGRPFPADPSVAQWYPNAFGYLMSAFALVTGLDVLDSFKILPPALMLASALSTYALARRLFGNYPGILALFVLGILSFQPRQTLNDGTFIEILAAYVLMPVFLLGLYRLLASSDARFVALTGFLGGAVIQYHLMATTQAIAVSAIFLALLLLFRKDLFGRGLAKRTLVASGLALILGLPYSYRYAMIYATMILGRLGLLPTSEHEARFPSLVFPSEFDKRLGHTFFHLAVLSVAVFIVRHLLKRKPKAETLIMASWIAFLLLGSLTHVFLTPERFLRNLALPLSMVIALTLYELRRRRVLLSTALAITIVLGVPHIVSWQLMTGKLSVYGEEIDLGSLEALHDLMGAKPDTYVLTDESGIWAHYFAEGRAYFIRGGPESFAWVGKPRRTVLEMLYIVLQEPCRPESQESLSRFQISYVYLGRRPTHWTPPGYQYNDGSRFLNCPYYELVYSEKTPQGPIRIFEARPIDQ